MKDKDSNLIYEVYLREWSPSNDPANNPGLAAGVSLLRAQDGNDPSRPSMGHPWRRQHGYVNHPPIAQSDTQQNSPDRPTVEDFENLVQTLHNGHSVTVMVDGVEGPMTITDEDYNEDDNVFEAMDANDRHVTFRPENIDSWQRTE